MLSFSPHFCVYCFPLFSSLSSIWQSGKINEQQNKKKNAQGMQNENFLREESIKSWGEGNYPEIIVLK